MYESGPASGFMGGGRLCHPLPVTSAAAYIPRELLERYRPIRKLGAGGMGVVVLVHDLELGRDVVLKTTRGVANDELRERAVREGRLLAEVRHPNVVEVYDSGEAPEGPYLVMEYLEGTSLLAGDPDPLGAMQVLVGALEAVHAAGLLHRDLKPDNVFRCRDGRVVLVDFGLALGPDQTRLTGTGLVVGTLPFIAPEALSGQPMGPAADWYGWGATLYAMLVRKPPRRTEDIMAIVRGEQTPPVDLAPISSPIASALLAETLVLDPEVRAGGARIRQLYARAEVAPPAEVTSVVLPEQDLGERPTATPAPTKGRRWLPGAAVAGLVLGLVWPGARPPPPPPPTAATPAPPRPPGHVLRRQDLEGTYPALDRATGYPAAAADPLGVSPGPEDLDLAMEGFSSGVVGEAWSRFLEASFRWLDSLPEQARRGGEFEVEEYVWRQLYPRTMWLTRVRGALVKRVHPEAMSLEFVTERHVQLRVRITELDDETASIVARFDVPRLRTSPLWARLSLQGADAADALGSVDPTGAFSEAMTAAFLGAVQERRGNPAAWRHDLTKFFKQYPNPRVPSLDRRLEVLEGLEESLDAAPVPFERDYWVLCMTREAARVAHCDPEMPGAPERVAKYFGWLREGWSSPDWRRVEFARELRRAAKDPRCGASGWSQSFVEEVRAWEGRGSEAPGRSP